MNPQNNEKIYNGEFRYYDRVEAGYGSVMKSE